MTEDDCKDKISRFLTGLLSDMDEAAKMVADGFVWENYLPEHVPFGGRYEGVEGLRTYVAELAKSWEIGALDVSEVIVGDGGRRFAAIGVERGGKSLTTGKSCDMPFVWIFRTDAAGRFTSVREYNDTAAIGGTFA